MGNIKAPVTSSFTTRATGSSSSGSPINKVLDGLRKKGCNPKEAGNSGQWRSTCPVHGGKSTNLSIKETSDGTVVLNCHHTDAQGKTCENTAIIKAIGLTMNDLFPPKFNQPSKPKPKPTGGNGKVHTSAAEAIAVLARAIGGKSAGEWIYRDSRGEMRSARFDKPDGKKEFRPIYQDATGWHVGDPPGLLPLYHLDTLAAAPVVFVLEGEKITDIARSIGLVATTSSHGCGSAHRSDWTPLAGTTAMAGGAVQIGKTVVLIPDNDEPGEGYINAIGAILEKLTPKPTIKVVRLPRLANQGDDFEQWFEGCPDTWGPDECRAEIERLAALAPEWAPPPEVQAPTELDKEIEKQLANYQPKTFGQIVKSVGELVHLWLNWLIIGNLSLIYSKPKMGKTRVYIRFIKTLWYAERWADGAENRWPAGTKTIILPYDRNHQEIAAEMARQGIPDDAAICPHDPRDPTGASLLSLTDPLMLAILRRVLTQDKAVKLIVVDTLTYASEKSLSKPEDMKAILDGIMTLAMQFAVAVLVLIHENREGKALGRRICERARVLMKMERYSESDPKRLRFYVEESNFPERPALTVIHTDQGIDFDEDQGTTGASSDRRDTCARWLVEYLQDRVGKGHAETDYGTLISAAGDKGFAGVFNAVENRWSDRQLLNRAIKGINERAESLKDLHAYTVVREEKMKFGRSKPIISFKLDVGLDAPATVPFGAPF